MEAVIMKYHGQGSLRKKEVILAYCCRWLRVHHGQEAWLQVTSMVVRAGNLDPTSGRRDCW